MIKTIPEDIQVGDVFKKYGGSYEHAVYLGQWNESNLQTFLDLNLKKNLFSAIHSDHPDRKHVFVLFGGMHDILIDSVTDFIDSFSLERKYQQFTYPKSFKRVEEIVKKFLAPKKKQFYVSKMGRYIRCIQDGKFVKYANEIDERFVVWGEVENINLWQPVNIDYPTYLLLTGLKENIKEDDLLKAKQSIIDSLGCQKATLTPILEDFISLIDKVFKLKEHRGEAIHVISNSLCEFTRIQNSYSLEVTDRLKVYIERLSKP